MVSRRLCISFILNAIFCWFFHVNNSGVTATKYKKEAHEDWKRKHKEKMCYINTMSFFPKEKNHIFLQKRN